MARKLAMGTKELTRGKVMAMVSEGKISLNEAAGRLGVSYRQALRIKAADEARGDVGLIHGNQGRVSNHTIAAAVRERVLRVYRERYPDFGPTFAVEKLGEVEGIKVSDETLRQWLMAEGLWQGKRKRKEHRSRRDRRPCFGDLVQFDGSATCCRATMIGLRGGGGSAV
jgi:transposase